jgi:hypothetical protein
VNFKKERERMNGVGCGSSGCNLGDGDQVDNSLRPGLAKSRHKQECGSGRPRHKTDPISKMAKAKRARGVAYVVEHLPSEGNDELNPRDHLKKKVTRRQDI